MSYSDLQFNQTISFNNLQSGVVEGYFLAKTSIPSGTKQITKAEANTYVNINTSLSSYANKAANQLVVRDNLEGITNIYPYTIYALADEGAGVFAWKSIDGGNSFNQLGLYSSTWREIAGDVTGTYIAVIGTTSNYVQISNDSGVTFTATSLNSAEFYPYGVSMSTNGQFIAVSGFSIIPDGASEGYAKIAVSSNYGVSFATYIYPTLHPWGFQPGLSVSPVPFNSTGRISVSGNGQYMTAIYSYSEFVGFPFNYVRPFGFTINSNNYGASWSVGFGTTYGTFLGIALSETGQYQLLTTDWFDHNNVLFFWKEGVKGFASSNYGASFSEKWQDFSNLNGIDLDYVYSGNRNAGVSLDGKSMFGINVNNDLAPFGGEVRNRKNASSDFGSSFVEGGAIAPAVQWATVGQIPVSGITNSYVAMFTKGNDDLVSTLAYSTDGGFNAWYFKDILPRKNFIHVYNKALNTPELLYSYTLYYSSSVGLPEVEGANSAVEACALSANGIIVYTNSSSIAVGTKLYYDIYGITQIQANPSSSASQDYYRIDDNSIQFSNNYIIDSIGYCVAFTTFYISNTSLDIVITNVTVNGYSLENLTGSGFPLYTGNTINGYTTQQGALDVIIYYNCNQGGQRIDAIDSDLTATCTNTSIGSNSITLSGAILGSGTFQIYADDGTC
jgi:hypothetical protein